MGKNEDTILTLDKWGRPVIREYKSWCAYCGAMHHEHGQRFCKVCRNKLTLDQIRRPDIYCDRCGGLKNYTGDYSSEAAKEWCRCPK